MTKARGNIPPNPVMQGADVQKRLRRQTERWLERHDAKRIKRDAFFAKKKLEKAERQARENPALIAERQKALRLR